MPSQRTPVQGRARKRAIRARMAATGENYTVAMRAVDAEHAARKAEASEPADEAVSP